MTTPEKNDFAAKAAAEAGTGILAEILSMLKANKKWWMIPIFIVFFLFGLLILLSGTGLAPFIYTLF